MKHIFYFLIIASLMITACQYRNCCPPEATYSMAYPKPGEAMDAITIPATVDKQKEFEMSASKNNTENTTAPAETPENTTKTEPENQTEVPAENTTPPENSMETSSTNMETTEEFEGEFGSNEVPGLQTQIHDSVDPVDVGETTDYVLEVWTNGPKDAQNVRITAILPEETSFVSAKVQGLETAINYTVENNTIIFDTVPVLPPKKKVIYEMKIKIENPADIVGTFEIESDDFTKKVVKQEGTKAIKRT